MKRNKLGLLSIALIATFCLVSVSTQARITTTAGGQSSDVQDFNQNIDHNRPPKKPQCPTYWSPVCGANGVTYSNGCFARLAGAPIAYDGVCDGFVCPADMPAFYDQTASNEEWVAGGTCVEMGGIDGPPACPQSDWQRHVDDINFIESAYPWTSAVFDAQTGGNQTFNPIPHTLICAGLPSNEALHLFDDLNDCYHGVNDWMFDFTFAMIDFEWAVNVEEAIGIYSQRVALHGGECELDNAIGAPMGFHAEDNGAPWIYWNVRATDGCDYDGCRCDATVTGWTDGGGNWFEDTVVNNSGPVQGTDCADPRFNF